MDGEHGPIRQELGGQGGESGRGEKRHSDKGRASFSLLDMLLAGDPAEYTRRYPLLRNE